MLKYHDIRDSKGKFARKNQKKVDQLMFQTTLKPLGTMSVTIFGRQIVVTGGPFLAKPDEMLGIKMAAEIKAPADIRIDTQDFKTPPRDAFYDGLLASIVCHFKTDIPLYVGCMAGKGRTGLFMATLAYLAGEDDPVTYVRKVYYPHAVETAEQEKFVIHTFDREVFQRDMMRLLQICGAIDFTDLRAMSWKDRLLWLRVKFGR